MARLSAKDKLNQRVAAGVAYLNVRKPGWYKKIDLESLNVASASTCVLGELYGEYAEGRDALGLDSEAATAMGFKDSGKKYKALTEAWKNVIKRLKRKK